LFYIRLIYFLLSSNCVCDFNKPKQKLKPNKVIVLKYITNIFIWWIYKYVLCV